MVEILEALQNIMSQAKINGSEALTAVFLTTMVAALPLLMRALKIFKEKPSEKNHRNSIEEKVIFFVDKYFPSWQSLKNISNNKIFRTSYLWFILVPIIAKILSNTEKGANFTLQSFPSLKITMAVPFSWNLFYFGSLAFVVAGVLYSWKAPNLIKKYKNFKDFLEKDSSGVAIVNEVEKNLETFKEKNTYFNNLYYYFDKEKNQTNELTSTEKESLKIKYMMNLSNDKMANLYAISIEYLDGKFLLSRVITTLLYFLSFSFYGYVILQQSIFVINEFIRHT